MFDTNIIRQAVYAAYEAYDNSIVDLRGYPIQVHIAAVANQFPANSDERALALLHDVIEDDVMTYGDVAKVLYDAYYFSGESKNKEMRMINDVDDMLFDLVIITRNKERTKTYEGYMDYIKHIKCYPVARFVKIADLRHNAFRPLPPGKIKENDIKRITKYLNALMILEEKDNDDESNK